MQRPSVLGSGLQRIEKDLLSTFEVGRQDHGPIVPAILHQLLEQVGLHSTPST